MGDPFGERYHRRAVTGADDQIASPSGRVRYGPPRLGDGQRWVGCHRVGCVLPVHSGCVASVACGGAEATARSLYTCLCEVGFLLLWLV